MVKQERAARTRDTLIRSAAEVFDREGFPLASLTAISTRAGVSSGALHFHFASKSTLADVVEAEALARLLVVTGAELPAGAEPPASAEPSAGAGHVQLLIDVTHGLAEALRADVVLRAGFTLSGEPARPVRADLRGHWRCWVEETVKRAEAEGELRPEVTAQDVVTAVVAATVGFEVLGLRDAEWLAASTVARFWRLLLPTLVPADRFAVLETSGTGAVRDPAEGAL
ncbi:ScbR family autoregulator-binding transcription factor [Streptomyces sp. NPDC087917]|uniref:ScbR family autoregulator-binding transcription factor n=1 Tax=unclassified Streptomyces TaxID=2593676 RepID=UPI0034386834